jgi:hypothetical protein
MPTNHSSQGLGIGESPRSEMLDKLQRREITLDQYLDYCAEEAVAHLKGLVDPERLECIQSTIRDQLTTDPVLIRYVEQATGMSPEADKVR